MRGNTDTAGGVGWTGWRQWFGVTRPLTAPPEEPLSRLPRPTKPAKFDAVLSCSRWRTESGDDGKWAPSRRAEAVQSTTL